MASAKNEAKILFKAETAEFESSLKSAQSEMSTLRAEMKLAEATFKATGDAAEYQKSKTEILESQLEANAQKQEALTQKLEAAKSIYGENSVEAETWATKLTRAKTEQQNLETQLQQCTQEIKEQTAAEEKAQTPLEQLNSTITEQKSKLEQLKTQYKNVALESGDESTEAQELKTKINQLNTELGENEAKLKEVDAALDETGSSAEAAANGGWTVFKGVVSDLASNAIQQGIDKVKDFAKDTVQLGVDFSSSMSNVQALSGATGDQLAELEKTARDLGLSTIFSASDVADAFGYMALAGWDTSQMLSGIDGVLNLAAAADMDLATASDIVTDNLTAFGLSAQDSGAFVDQMAYAMANSNTNVEQLGDAYKNCASTASSMGFTVEDTTAALMTMANAGVKGGEAGTGLSSIMTRLATDTKGCAGELEKYGVEVYDSQGNMNDLSSILNGCAGVWSDLSDEEQANLAKTIAGQSQFSKFQTVMQGLSEQVAESGQSFNDYTAELENVKTASEEGKSAAEDMANTMQDNLGGDIKTLSGALEELKLKIFDSVEEPMRKVVQAISGSVIPAVTQVLQFMQQHSTALGMLGAAIGIITTAIIAHSAAQAIQTAMNAAEVSSLGALIAAKYASAAASLAALAPYILIVAAIAAVIAIIVLCVKHWDQIRAAVGAAVAYMGQVISAGFSAIASVVTSITTAIHNKITSIWSAIQRVTTTVWSAIRNAISRPLTAAKNLVSTISATIRSKLTSAFNSAKSATTSAWNLIKNSIVTPITNAKNTASNTVTTLQSKVTSTFTTLKSSVQSTWGNIKQKISDAITKAKETVSNMVEAIKGFFNLSDLVSKVKSTFDDIKEKMTKPITDAKDKISNIISDIKGKFPFSLGKLVKFKLPTVTVTRGEFGIPKFKVSGWHAHGAVFRRPVIFGNPLTGYHGFGEAGPEVAAPLDTITGILEDAARRGNPGIDYDRLGTSVAKACARMNISIDLDNRTLGRVVRGLA